MIHYIIIDASYFILYRYHALKAWWKFSNKDIFLGDSPHKNIEFMDKYISTFGEKLSEIIVKMKINVKNKNDIIKYIIAKDCKRSTIWRNDIYSSYKGTREKSIEETSISFIFKYVFDNNLFLIKNKNITEIQIVEYERLEADDCISLCVKYIKDKYEEKLLNNEKEIINSTKYNIIIIASDIDYLQLCNENINVYNLKYNNINNNSQYNSQYNSELNLFIKIVTGDKSDNISGIFKKCGHKTALKYYENKDNFEKKLNESNVYKELYERNKLLIDFNKIPEFYSNGFYNKYYSFLSTL